MHRFLTTLGIIALALGCASAPRPPEPQKLYFALEVRHEGRLVAKPKLLGEAGVKLRAERRQPGARAPDYRLLIDPKETEGRYHVGFDLELPQGIAHSELDLLHGEERKLQLGSRPGELEVSMLLMKVDSPEFRALMRLSEQEAARAGSAGKM
jgi:hypothetical protein